MRDLARGDAERHSLHPHDGGEGGPSYNVVDGRHVVTSLVYNISREVSKTLPEALRLRSSILKHDNHTAFVWFVA